MELTTNFSQQFEFTAFCYCFVFLAEPAGLLLKILLLLFKFLSNKFNQSDQNEGRILLSFDICKSSHPNGQRFYGKESCRKLKTGMLIFLSKPWQRFFLNQIFKLR